MSVELLVMPDCPNEAGAAELLRTALDDIGLRDVQFTTTVIDTQESAEARHFIGSPTILLDGVDPFHDSNAMPSLACRVYLSGDGLGGIPDLRALRKALKRSAHVSRSH
jgi:hypothetical protein